MTLQTQNQVNDTREGVANARDGFGLSSVVVGANTGSIVVDADGNDVRDSILTNGDHILVSDYFTAAVASTSGLTEIVVDSFTENGSEFDSNGFTYGSFTDFVLGTFSASRLKHTHLAMDMTALV